MSKMGTLAAGTGRTTTRRSDSPARPDANRTPAYTASPLFSGERAMRDQGYFQHSNNV